MHIDSKKTEKLEVKAGEKTTMQMLISPSIAPNFAMRKFTMEANGSMPLHTNTVEHEQYVLSGSAQVVLGDEKFEAKKDDVIYVPKDIPHSYQAGEDGYEFLCLVPNEDDDIKMCSC